MGKTEIMQELARLSPQDLAEVRAHLDRLARDNGTPADAAPAGSRDSARIRSPRLANRSQTRDFIKQVLSA